MVRSHSDLKPLLIQLVDRENCVVKTQLGSFRVRASDAERMVSIVQAMRNGGSLRRFRLGESKRVLRLLASLGAYDRRRRSHARHVALIARRSRRAVASVLRRAGLVTEPNDTLCASSVESGQLTLLWLADFSPAERLGIERAAHNACSEVLPVQVIDGSVMVGPRMGRGRRGCSRCAFERWRGRHAARHRFDDVFEEEVFFEFESALDLIAACGPALVAVRRAVRRSLPEGLVLIADATGQAAWHDLQPVSDCPVCGRCEVPAPRAHALICESVATSVEQTLSGPSGLAQFLERTTPLVGPLGVLSEPVRVDGLDKIGVPVVHLEIAVPVSDRESPTMVGGKGLTEGEARASGIGEGLERYCAVVRDSDRLLVKSFAALGDEALDPRRLILDPQHPVRYSEHLPLEWVPAFSLTAEAPLLVPANAVYFVYRPRNGASRFMPHDTVGLACAPTWERAVLHGLLELIEKDAETLIWRCRRICPNLALDRASDAGLGAVVDRFERAGIRLHVKSLWTDLGVYVVHALAEDAGGHEPVFSRGICCHLNPAVACLKALMECAQIRVNQCQLLETYPAYRQDAGKMREPALRWAAGVERQNLAFLTSRTGDTLPLGALPDLATGNPASDLRRCVEQLRELGLEVIVADLSREDVPFPTVRVLVPGLQPYGNSRRVSERLRRLAPEIELVNRQPMLA